MNVSGTQLREAGFRELTLAVGNLPGLIESYFGNGARFGVSIAYSIEDKPLGTAGPLSLMVVTGGAICVTPVKQIAPAHGALG